MKLMYNPSDIGGKWSLEFDHEELEELALITSKALKSNLANETLKNKSLRQPYFTLGVLNQLLKDGKECESKFHYPLKPIK